jgi:hypothetical protein
MKALKKPLISSLQSVINPAHPKSLLDRPETGYSISLGENPQLFLGFSPNIPRRTRPK